MKLRLSTTLGEVKLPVYSNDTIAIAKKKLQVSTISIIFITLSVTHMYMYMLYDIACYLDIVINNNYNPRRIKKVWNHRVKGGFLVVNYWVIKCI